MRCCEISSSRVVPFTWWVLTGLHRLCYHGDVDSVWLIRGELWSGCDVACKQLIPSEQDWWGEVRVGKHTRQKEKKLKSVCVTQIIYLIYTNAYFSPLFPTYYYYNWVFIMHWVSYKKVEKSHFSCIYKGKGLLHFTIKDNWCHVLQCQQVYFYLTLI